MDATAPPALPLRARTSGPPLAAALRGAAWSAVAALLAAGLWLAVRRGSGGLAAPLGLGPLLLVGFAGGGLAAALRPRGAVARSPLAVGGFVAWRAALALGWSLCGDSLLSAAAVWLGLVAEVAAARWGAAVWMRLPAGLALRGWRAAWAAAAGERSAAKETPSAARGGPLPRQVIQQFTRADSPAGETVHGRLRARFAPGERLQVLHVAFCPPFAAAPELTAAVPAGRGATAKPTHVQPFGARFEVRLPAAAERAEEVVVEFSGAVTAAAESRET